MGYVKAHLQDVMYDAALDIYLNYNINNLRQDEIEEELWELWELHDPMIENSEEMVMFYKDHNDD